MNLKYRILWVEDERDWVASEIEFIKSFLEQHGFTLEYENPEKYEDLEFSKFDIIIVDYNLANDEEGQDVIEKIRNKELYTEILFYSQDGEDKLRKIIAEKEGIDGVYCSSKNNCITKLKKLIYTTIRKTQDLNNLRGLVMAETSELDEMMKRILTLVKDKNSFVKVIQNGPCLQCKEPKKTIFTVNNETIFEFNGVENLDKNIRNATAFILYEQIKKYLGSSLYIGSKNIDSYHDEIRKDRINLAHYPEDTSTSVLMKVNGVEYNEEKFVNIRKKIQEYKNIFQEIIDELSI